MNVKILATGKTAAVNDSYGARLIEQGKAVQAPKTAAKKTAAKKDVTADAAE